MSVPEPPAASPNESGREIEGVPNVVSAPITFSGFNNIDFNQILNAIMLQARAPLTVLEDRQKALRSQIGTFDALGGNVTSLRTAADALGSLSSVATIGGTSSDKAVSVTAAAGATAGHYDVVVTEIARAQVTVSTTSSVDRNTTTVAGAGTLTIGGVDVVIAGDVTMQGLADAINATEGIGVRAAVLRTGTSTYRLALTSIETGADQAFTVTASAGVGIAFAANAVEASDASILFNNVQITTSSNTFEDIVPGVTLTVSAADAEKTIAVDLAPDAEALATKVQSFIDAYNNFVKFSNAQRMSATAGDGASIGRDPALRQLRNALRTELLGEHGAGIVTRLAEVGVEFTSTGTLTLNRSVFDDAVAANGDQVRSLLAGTGGVFPNVETILNEFSGGAGVISAAKERLNRQISSMDTQITAMQVRLALQRSALQREFAEADAAMSRLKGQSGSLASFGASVGGL
jgi:flagellar hook-associated protein 2